MTQRDRYTNVTTTYTGLPAQTLSYKYYPNGQLQTLATPAGSFSGSYDAEGRLVSLTNPYAQTFSWDFLDNGWLHRQHTPAVQTDYALNVWGVVTDTANTRPGNNSLLSDFGGILFDGAGNVVSIRLRRGPEPLRLLRQQSDQPVRPLRPDALSGRRLPPCLREPILIVITVHLSSRT